jgi:hypothetical protein
MTVTSQSEALPGDKATVTLTGKSLGPRAADQKPDDIITSGGAVKVNILEAASRPWERDRRTLRTD